MCYDLPRVEYAKTDKEGNVIKKKDSSYDEVAEKNNQLLERMKARKMANNYSTQQASDIGEKISLTNLLEGK